MSGCVQGTVRAHITSHLTDTQVTPTDSAFLQTAHSNPCLSPVMGSQHHAGQFCPQGDLVLINPEESCIFIVFGSTKILYVTQQE